MILRIFVVSRKSTFLGSRPAALVVGVFKHSKDSDSDSEKQEKASKHFYCPESPE